MQQLQQIISLLREENPEVVLELLELSSDELVDAFLEKIEEKFEYLRKQYE